MSATETVPGGDPTNPSAAPPQLVWTKFDPRPAPEAIAAAKSADVVIADRTRQRLEAARLRRAFMATSTAVRVAKRTTLLSPRKLGSAPSTTNAASCATSSESALSRPSRLRTVRSKCGASATSSA